MKNLIVFIALCFVATTLFSQEESLDCKLWKLKTDSQKKEIVFSYFSGIDASAEFLTKVIKDMSKEKLASSDYGTLSKYIDDSRKLLMMHTTTESIEIFIAMMDSCFMNSPGDTFEDALTTSLLKMMKYNKSQSE